MPNFKVFADKESSSITLRLHDEGDGEVSVIAVDDSGNRITGGSICSFTTSGTLSLHGSISKSLGLKLDSFNKIVVE